MRSNNGALREGTEPRVSAYERFGCAKTSLRRNSLPPEKCNPGPHGPQAAHGRSGETINPSMSAELLRRRAGSPGAGGAETGGSAT